MTIDSNQGGFFVGEVLEQTAQRYADKTALIAKEGELTFAQVNERSSFLAGHLQTEGIKPGDRVGLFLLNSNAFALCYYAIQRIGAVSVVLDARFKGKELSGVLQDADLNLCITHQRLMPEISPILADLKKVPLWVVEGEGEQAFEKRLSAPPKDFVRPKLNPDQDAVILYTSGTTGEPKGVILSYVNLTQFPYCMGQVWKTNEKTVLGCVLPMSHISGPIYCNEIIDKGSTMVIFDQMNPVTLLEGIQKHRVTFFHGIPIIFQLLLSVPNLNAYDTRSVEIVGMMGMSVPLPLMRAFKSVQPHIKAMQGYGLTETSPLVTGTETPDADDKLGSIGKPVPGIEVKIVDDKGNEVGEGEEGEIITRGPHVMKGYFRKPEATAERIRGGWLYTGDIARREGDGYYYHLGRKDDMIITGGMNVYPADVENMLYELPQVQEAVVFPIPDAKRGNVIGAAVVPRQGQSPNAKEIIAFLRSNLAIFKVPQEVKIRESLPRTLTGKVIRDASVLLADS